MLLVIDIGNTRTKWALAGDDGKLLDVEVCLNADIAKSTLLQAAQQADKAVIANVAGEAIAQQISQLLAPLETHFISAKTQACGVINSYRSALGADRWAALVAAWHVNRWTTVVVNAGTAITIDALGPSTKKNGLPLHGLFLGGTIMPGLRLMHESLSSNTAQLEAGEGSSSEFPTSTQDAMHTGCINAVAGAIYLMTKRLEKQVGAMPKLVISGGDAREIAQALNATLIPGLNRVIIIENLVLQGLVLLEKE